MESMVIWESAECRCLSFCHPENGSRKPVSFFGYPGDSPWIQVEGPLVSRLSHGPFFYQRKAPKCLPSHMMNHGWCTWDSPLPTTCYIKANRRQRLLLEDSLPQDSLFNTRSRLEGLGVYHPIRASSWLLPKMLLLVGSWHLRYKYCNNF